eukprot:6030362-Lingulodinium_polyedra.AAC.1
MWAPFGYGWATTAMDAGVTGTLCIPYLSSKNRSCRVSLPGAYCWQNTARARPPVRKVTPWQ